MLLSLIRCLTDFIHANNASYLRHSRRHKEAHQSPDSLQNPVLKTADGQTPGQPTSPMVET